MLSIADAFDYLQSRGLPKHVAAGVVGNLQVESGSGGSLNPDAFNPNDNGKSSFGIAQWRDDRQTALRSFAAAQGKPANDGYLQLDFLLHELQTSEKSAGDAILATSSHDEAASAFDATFERSDGKARNQRIAYAAALMGLSPNFSTNAGPDMVANYGDTSSANVPTPSYISSLDEMNARKAADEAASGRSFAERLGDLGKAAGDAWSDETATSWAMTNLGRNSGAFLEDKSFTLDNKQTFDRLTAGLPSDYHEYFSQAVSMEHAMAIREQALADFQSESRLAGYGWGGAALRLGAAVLDPVAIGATVLTEGAAAPVIYGAKIGRVGRILRAGAAGAAINSGLDTFITASDPTREVTASGVLAAAAIGFGFGALSGSLRHGPSVVDQELAIAMRPLAASEGSQAFRGESTAGAKFVGQMSPQAQLSTAFADAPEPALAGLRIDNVGRAMAAAGDSGLARDVAEGLGENAVGNRGNALSRISVEEKVESTHRSWDAAWKSVLTPNLRKWMKANGKSWWDADAVDEFMENVGRATRRGNLDLELDPHVRAAASKAQSTFAKLLDWGKQMGVKGFDTIKADDTYVTRLWNLKAIDSIGESNATRLIAGAIMDGTRMTARQAKGEVEDILEEEALALAKGLINSVRRQRFGAFEIAQGFSGADTKLLREMLEDGQNLDPKMVDNIVSKFEAKPLDADGKISPARRRINLNEQFEMRLGEGGKVGIADLLDNNIDRLMGSYMRQLFGAGYMEEFLGRYAYVGSDGIKVAPSWAQLRDTVRASLKGDPTGYLDRLDFLHKVAVGRAVDNPSVTKEYLRLLRNFSFTRLMGQSGIAQLPEMGMILAHGGLKATMAQVPMLRRIFKRAADGQLEDGLAREIEAAWGAGTDYLRAIPGVGSDDYGVYNMTTASAKWFRSADFITQRLGQVTTNLSGLRFIDAALKRMNYRVIVQRFADDAKAGKTLSLKRLHSLGLTDEMAGRIQEQLRTHVKRVGASRDVPGGGRVSSINLDAWTDKDAASAFRFAVDRFARRTVQENSRGAMPMFMSSGYVKTIAQFRTFMLGAYTKLLLAGMQQRDAMTFMSFAFTTTLGGLAYVAQTSINTIGVPDRDKLLKERLTTAEIAKAGFQRAGFSSLLPMVTDTALGMAGLDPQFQNGRTTGLSTGAVIGNPTIDLIDTSSRALKNTVRAATDPDYHFSQRNLADWASLAPLKSVMGFRNALAILGADLPEDNK